MRLENKNNNIYIKREKRETGLSGYFFGLLFGSFSIENIQNHTYAIEQNRKRSKHQILTFHQIFHTMNYRIFHCQ